MTTQEAGVDVQLYTQIVRPLSGDGRVEGVVVENASGRAALRAKIVVDATGDAAVAAASGVPCAGEEGDLRLHRQPCTLVFRMSNVDVKRFRGIPREVKRAIALEGIGERRLFWESLSFCSTPGGSDAVCLMSRIPGIDALDANDLTRAAMDGRQQVKSIVDFLLERVPGFEHSVLAGIAERVGVRETRRIYGRYTLTQEDILNNVRFPDAIALGAGPMDLHEPGGTGLALWMPDAPFEFRCAASYRKRSRGSWWPAAPSRQHARQTAAAAIWAPRCALGRRPGRMRRSTRRGRRNSLNLRMGGFERCCTRMARS